MALIDGLRAYWKLDETSGTRYDSTANDNDLTDNNSVLYGTGKQSNAADFELSNSEYLSIADNAYLSFGDEDFSIVAWVKLESSTEYGGIATKYDYGNADREYTLYYNNSNTKFAFGVSGDGTASTHVTANTFGAASLATWYFVAAYHDATANKIGISVNAGAFDTANHTAGCNDNVSTFLLGGVLSSSAHAQKLDGLLDEVGVWNRVLSAAEIGLLYNGGSGTTYPLPQEMYTARYHDYNFTAPQRFTISSNEVQMTARYRDYNFTAPKKEYYG